MLRFGSLASVFASTAAIVALSCSCEKAAAGESAFKITGGGVATTGLPLPGQAPRTHSSTGQATHLGRYTGDGTINTDSAAFDPDIGLAGGFAGEFGSASPYVFTAADGSQLVTWYGRTDHGAATPGTFVLTIIGVTGDGLPIVVALFIAEFVIDPDASTGRFAGATGSWIMYANTDPFVLGSSDPTGYTWEGEGRINLKQ